MKLRQKKGFTLVELIMTMLLMAVMAAVAIPLFVDLHSVKVDSAAKKLVSDLSYARQLARNRNAIYGVSFDVVANSYTVYLYNPATNSETPVTDPMTRTPMIVDLTQLSGLRGVDILSAFFAGNNKVRFNPQGVPQNGAGTLLASVGQVVLEEGGKVRTVSVQPATGEVSEL